MFFQLAEPVHVVFFLVQLEGVETVLLVVLVVDILRGLLPRYLLLGGAQLLIYRLEHASLLVRLSLFLLLRILIEQLVRDIQQLPQMRVLGLQLLDVELIGLNH